MGIVPLASEHSVTLLKHKLLGAENKGFKIVKTLNIKKWFRKYKSESDNQVNGSPARHQVVWSFVPANQTKCALEHWIGYLAKSGQILRLIIFNKVYIN